MTAPAQQGLFAADAVAITDPGEVLLPGAGAEFFPTAERAIVQALFEGMAAAGHEPLPLHGRVRESAAGEGALVEHVNALVPSVTRRWDMYELRITAAMKLRARVARPVFVGDFLSLVASGQVDRVPCAITNPPWSRIVPEWAAAELATADVVALHGPLATLETPARAGWLRDHMPDVYPLEWRPDYDGRGGVARAVAWFVFGPGRGGRWYPLKRPGL